MSVTKPFKRACRQFMYGGYSKGGCSDYIKHPKYANTPTHYIRPFLLLQKDLQQLFDYIEPADSNKGCYSYRLHELLLRVCVEVEVNFKAILQENIYSKAPRKWDIADYQKINRSHHLSSYRVLVPYWDGKTKRAPFMSWNRNQPLKWYQAYNDVKHNRCANFALASLNNVIDAMCGLVVILSAQFYTYDFSPGPSLILQEGPNDGTESAIGDYFRVCFPTDWPKYLRYDFIWQDIQQESDPFNKFDYDKIKS
jgi:hypothetical protein